MGSIPEQWTLDIEKLLEGEYWTNRYVIAAIGMASAVNFGQQIVDIERAMHLDNVLFTRYRISDRRPDTDVYQVVNLNVFGSVARGTNHYLPLFNVVRVDFNTSGGGRPSRKYYRTPITENNVDNGKFVQTYLTALQTQVNALIAVTAFQDVDGQNFTNGTVYPFVGMRQLRRGSKRKASAPSAPTG